MRKDFDLYNVFFDLQVPTRAFGQSWFKLEVQILCWKAGTIQLTCDKRYAKPLSHCLIIVEDLSCIVVQIKIYWYSLCSIF
jgi:hypothetical protein